ncbi:integrase family protein [Nocardiopsis sp. JB363]|nr:integrase family protein [Nocardiopsis sp. JB363]
MRRGGFVSREAARESLRRVRDLEGGDADPAVLTVGAWLEHWLATRTGLRPLTRTSYAEHIHRHLQPHLGALVLEELTPATVAQAFDSISRHRSPTGALLSAATVQRVRATLRAALNTAVGEGLLVSNPAKGLRLEGGRAARPMVWTDQAVEDWRNGGVRPVVAVWTVEQTRAFLGHVSQDRLYGLFHLAVMTGLRRGEIVGLRWPDIDLVRGTVRVERQLQSHQGRLVELAPKSAASRRMLSVDHTTLGVLRRHQWYQQQEARGQGRVWDSRGFVFTALRGGALAPERLSRLFRKLNTESGLPPVRLHDLRHGAATLALAAGVELKVVQAMLGHASIVLTADTYSTVLPQVAREAAERTAWLVLRDSGRAHRRGTARRVRRGLAPPRPHPGPISARGR